VCLYGPLTQFLQARICPLHINVCQTIEKTASPTGVLLLANFPCVSVVARQRLGKPVSVAVNTHAAVEELLDVLFSMHFVSNQRKVGDQFFPELLVISDVISRASL
jgi:hypothetical protein